MILPAQVRKLRRERLGYTQRELARALDVSEVVISRWERGVNEPQLRHLRTMADLAGVSVSWFFEEAA